MNTFFLIKNETGSVIADTFPPDFSHLKNERREPKESISLRFKGKYQNARIGKKIGKNGEILILTFERRYVKRLKFFREFLDSNFLLIDTIQQINESTLNKHNLQTKELIHNLISINTYNIQNLSSLIPGHLLPKDNNINAQKEVIKKIIQEKPNMTVDTLLDTMKNNLATKVEFSVFNKLLAPHKAVQKMNLDIRKAILSIIQIFLKDFKNKEITISLDACNMQIYGEIESLTVSFFFIIENAIKYCLRGKTLKIRFDNDTDGFCVIFDMISTQILPEEINKICELGYRGKSAEKIGEPGMGIGMNRVLKTLDLNDAILEIVPKVDEYSKINGGVTYEHNVFKVKFLGQKQW